MRGEEVNPRVGAARIEPVDPERLLEPAQEGLAAGELLAGSRGCWRLVYRAGSAGVAVGGAVRLEIPYAFTVPQQVCSSDPGYLAVERAPEGVRLELEFPAVGYEWKDPRHRREKFCYVTRYGRHVFAHLVEGELGEGGEVSFLYGPPGEHGTGRAFGPCFAHTAVFPVAVDPDGRRAAPYSGLWLVAEAPKMEIRPAGPVRLQAAIGATSPEGEDLEISVTGRDRFGNPGAPLRARLSLTCPWSRERLGEREVEVPRGRAVSLRVPRPRGLRAGAFRVRLEGGGLSGETGPVLLGPAGGRGLLFGEIHTHTRLSDGLGTQEGMYAFARDLTRLDFAASADHGQYLSDRDWEEIKSSAGAAEREGRFVALAGYEYSDNRPEVGYGDLCIYHPDFTGPCLRVTDLYRSASAYRELPEVAGELARRGAIIVLHQHAGGRKFYREDLVRLAEVHSVWGTSEYQGNPNPLLPARWQGQSYAGLSVQDYFAAGFRLGLIAGTDCHAGHPGDSNWLRRSVAYHAGLAAVWADSLEHRAVFEALRARRCYGTSGARIAVEFGLGGAPMGAELELAEVPAGARFRGRVAGTAPIAALEVLVNNRVAHRSEPGADYAEFEWDGLPARADLCAPTEHTRVPFGWVYLRVTQADGERAWTSPVWLLGG